MTSVRRTLLSVCLLVVAAQPLSAQSDTTRLTVQGVQAPVEIIRDHCGINHIYAQIRPGLCFAQGYAAARARLCQVEIWRRRATGTVAEILGPRELKRDIGARLFRFRGDITAELNHYHPQGAEVITSFVRGVNA